MRLALRLRDSLCVRLIVTKLFASRRSSLTVFTSSPFALRRCGALNTEGPKTKIPAHSHKRRAIRTGIWSAELYFVGRDSGGTRPARR
jgi:hypothetical protein